MIIGCRSVRANRAIALDDQRRGGDGFDTSDTFMGDSFRGKRDGRGIRSRTDAALRDSTER